MLINSRALKLADRVSNKRRLNDHDQAMVDLATAYRIAQATNEQNLVREFNTLQTWRRMDAPPILIDCADPSIHKWITEVPPALVYDVNDAYGPEATVMDHPSRSGWVVVLH